MEDKPLTAFRTATQFMRHDIKRKAGRVPLPTKTAAIERVLMETFVSCGHGTIEAQGAVAFFIATIADLAD